MDKNVVPDKIRILFHVYNISGYLIACLEELLKHAEIAVIETPCIGIDKGAMATRVQWIDRTRIQDVCGLDAAVADFRPDIFCCGGWADKICVKYARMLHKRGCKTVLLVDTPWQARARQIIHCLYSRLYLTNTFDYAWVAGAPQERYMRYLGFPKLRIRQGCYCANTAKFAPIGEERERCFEQEKKWPHVFLYIGRYVSVKNMRRMERAFLKAIEKMPESDWTLRCIGSGVLWNERTIHPRIEHLGYKRPDEIQEFVKGAGCFVLPSVYEPWGVVVHEAALMGLPMVCSNQVQAATAYLKEGENGVSFNPLDEDDLAFAFKKIMMLGDNELYEMGIRSHAYGKMYTLADWCKTASEFVL